MDRIFFKVLICAVNFFYHHPWLEYWTSPVAQMVKNLPAMQETQVRFLGRENSLEKGMASHSSILYSCFANNKTDVQREHAVWPGLLVSCRTGY